MITSAILSCFLAQTFSPQLPEAIPAVKGDVVEPFAMRYIDVEVGQGAVAEAGQRYTVHYTGWLRDGKKFDSSRDRDRPFQFIQGRRQVIAGWEAGFVGMKVGGKRRLFLPHQLAYGEKGNAAIPPRSELIFDVELLGVEAVSDLVPAAEILNPVDELEKKVLGLAKAVPEDKYDWRPAKGVRSFREVFLHIAYGNKLMTDLSESAPEAAAVRARVEKQWKDETAPLPKSTIEDMLAASFADIRKRVTPLRAGAMASEIRFFNENTTRRGVLIRLDNHISEHLGQLIAYARMCGITPPWAEPAAR